MSLSNLDQSLDPVDRSNTFRCKRRQRDLSEKTCFNMFCEVHAMRAETNPCYMCRQGAALRIEYAIEKEPTERRVDAMLVLAKGKNIQPWAYRALGIGCG
jgi:hypothetical protein